MVTKLSAQATPRSTPPRGLRILTSPFVVFVVALLVVGTLVWAVVLASDDQETTNIACPMSPEAEEAGMSTVGPQALDDVDPAPLSQTSVRVLNANGQTGQAGAIAARLVETGFMPSEEDAATNDPVYPAQDLECHGQIRFGEAGEATARSLSLAAPCMELVSDQRETAMVDLALGTTFAELSDSGAAVGALDRLATDGEPDPDQLTQARAVSC